MDVTAIARKKNESKALVWMSKDVFDLTAEDLRGFDGVVVSIGFWTPETYERHTKAVQHLAGLLKGTRIRLIVVGGAGSLYADETKKVRLVDTPEFPKMYHDVSASILRMGEWLMRQNDVWWTYFSPPLNFVYDAPKTGDYEWGTDVAMRSKGGKDMISYADFAHAVIDEAANGRYVQKHATVIGA